MQDNMPFDLNKFRPPKLEARLIRLVILGILVLLFLFSSIFTVGPEEVGVILRFGKFVRTVNPGLNFKIPFWIETLDKVPVERQLKQEFGFRTLEAGVRPRYSRRDFQQESLMLTGD